MEEHHIRSPKAQANRVAALARKPKGKHNIRTVEINVPGLVPSYATGNGSGQNVKHAETSIAIKRTEQVVGRVFDFLGELVEVGSQLTAKAKKGIALSVSEIEILKEARTTALKFIDKTVPDVVMTKTPESTKPPVQIIFESPIARLARPAIEITTEEDESGGAEHSSADSLQSEPERTEDSQFPA